MPTEAQKRATAKYKSKAYDRVEVTFKKGKREEIKQFAESKGLSLNSYINRLIERDMHLEAESSPTQESSPAQDE